MKPYRNAVFLAATATLVLTGCQTPTDAQSSSISGGSISMPRVNAPSATRVPFLPSNGMENDRDRAIHGSAKFHENNLDSSDVPGTDSGNFACAWAVNFVVKFGIHREVGGGLATANMAQALKTGRGVEVRLEDAPPGSVIISPTQYVNGSRNTGHVGILGQGSGGSRPIFSNSSGHAMWEKNFTVDRWVSYYSGRKGLPVRTYQINP